LPDKCLFLKTTFLIACARSNKMMPQQHDKGETALCDNASFHQTQKTVNRMQKKKSN
jgi:hypothetical protein